MNETISITFVKHSECWAHIVWTIVLWMFWQRHDFIT